MQLNGSQQHGTSTTFLLMISWYNVIIHVLINVLDAIIMFFSFKRFMNVWLM